MILFVSYLMIAIATYIDLVIAEKTTQQFKIVAPTKNRELFSRKIDELKKLQLYAIIWPYVIYKLIKN